MSVVGGLPGAPPAERPARRGRRLSRLTGRDLEAYLVAGTALVVGLLGLIDLADPGTVSAVTLAALGLLVFDTMLGRRQLRRVRSDLSTLGAALRAGGTATSADRVLQESVPGSAFDLGRAGDLRLVGVTLNRTVRNHLAELRRQLAAGGMLKVMIIDPDGPAAREAARRHGFDEDAEVFEHRLQPTLDLLRHLADTAGGRLEVRLLGFVPAFGLIMIDPETAGGRVLVDIYSHRPDGREAVVAMTAERDPIWFHHFRQEFDRIWQRGRPITFDHQPC